MPLNGTLQMAGPVALISAFLQKEVAAGLGHSKKKLTFGGVQDTLLHLTQLDIQHFLKLLAFQGVEYHHLAEAAYKFPTSFCPRRSGALPFPLLPQSRGSFHGQRR